MNTQLPPDYFIPNTKVTIETGANGFVCRCGKDMFIAKDPQELLSVVLSTTTNHVRMVEMQKAQQQALAENKNADG